MKIKELITGIRHIGVYVSNFDSSVERYKKIFDVEDDEIVMVPPPETKNPESRFAFIPVGGMDFELIHPISENFKNLTGNQPPGINHIAFTVTDIEKAVGIMNSKGIRLGHVTKEGILDMKRSRVAYFNPDDTAGILIEFVQPSNEKNLAQV